MTCLGCGVLIELKPEDMVLVGLYRCVCGQINSSKAKLYSRVRPKEIEP